MDASYELGPRGQLGWGSGLALAIWVGLGRVGQEVKKNNLRSKDDVWTVVFSESPWTANRRSPSGWETSPEACRVGGTGEGREMRARQPA